MHAPEQQALERELKAFQQTLAPAGRSILHLDDTVQRVFIFCSLTVARYHEALEKLSSVTPMPSDEPIEIEPSADPNVAQVALFLQ